MYIVLGITTQGLFAVCLAYVFIIENPNSQVTVQIVTLLGRCDTSPPT